MSDEAPVISVAELARRLDRAAKRVSGDAWVEGEIASVKRAGSGHVYFSLKDEREEATLDCVLYRFKAGRSGRYVEDGARVQLLGQATLWAPRGRLQLVVEQIRPQGRGALLEALEKLKARLAAEGLFDAARKRPLPAAPRVVGLVTSRAGAALHDVVTVAFRRGRVRVVLAPATVQGEEAPESLVRALDLIDRMADVEVVIVGRGGGAADDLMAFNDERVVRRMAAMRRPVVSAVGHEIDVTLADLVADVRAATPSQAAELVVADDSAREAALAERRGRLRRAMASRLRDDRALLRSLAHRLGEPRFALAEAQQRLDERRARLERALRRRLTRERARLTEQAARLGRRHPSAVLQAARFAVERLGAKLPALARRALSERRHALAALEARLVALSPVAVLERGYAVALDARGVALRAAAEASTGDAVIVRLGRGRLETRVEVVQEEEAS